jgi:hypothetical protein
MGGEGRAIDEAAHLGELGMGGVMVEDIVRLRRENRRAEGDQHSAPWMVGRPNGSDQRSY